MRPKHDRMRWWAPCDNPAPFIGATPLAGIIEIAFLFVFHTLVYVCEYSVWSLWNKTYLTSMDPKMTEYDRNGPANYPVKWPEDDLKMTQIGLRTMSKNDPSWPEFDIFLSHQTVIKGPKSNLANMTPQWLPVDPGRLCSFLQRVTWQSRLVLFQATMPAIIQLWY